MTNAIDHMTTLIAADLRLLIDADNRSADYASFRIAYDLLRIASADLAFATRIDLSHPDMTYYFSDSTYDEITNPATTIEYATAIIGIAYERNADDIDLDILANNIALAIDLHCRDYNLDDADADALLMPATLDELAEYIATSSQS